MPHSSKHVASARRRVRQLRSASPRPPRIKRSGDETALLETAWRALTIGRDAKGIVMARAGVVLKANALFGRLLQCSPASLEGKSVLSDILARPRGKDLRRSTVRWTALVAAADGTRIPVEITRERLKIASDV